MGSNPIETARDMTITAQECCNQIDKALKVFGEYNYYDKGPYEVMDMRKIMKRFNAMPATEVRDVLLEVMKHPHGEKFATVVLDNSQGRSDEEFEIMEQACPDGW